MRNVLCFGVILKTEWILMNLNCDKNVFLTLFSSCQLPAFLTWSKIYIIKYHYEKLTTIVSRCFPSNGKNSRMHTSKSPEFTFSNQTYMASSGFVSRVYLAVTNTDGLPPKLYNAFISFNNRCQILDNINNLINFENYKGCGVVRVTIDC